MKFLANSNVLNDKHVSGGKKTQSEWHSSLMHNGRHGNDILSTHSCQSVLSHLSHFWLRTMNSVWLSICLSLSLTVRVTGERKSWKKWQQGGGWERAWRAW